MNLSLVLLVLSVFVAYLIFDMFKKARQEQQINQVQQSNAPSNSSTNKLKPSYSVQCSILKKLHQEKMNTLKHKSISIHLNQQSFDSQIAPQTISRIQQIFETIKATYKIYFLVSRKASLCNPLIELLRKSGIIQIGFESTQGAVAVLRQLNCNFHLESQLPLYKTLVQYLPNVWIADGGKNEHLVNQYKTECEMLLTLNYLCQKKDKKEE